MKTLRVVVLASLLLLLQLSSQVAWGRVSTASTVKSSTVKASTFSASTLSTTTAASTMKSSTVKASTLSTPKTTTSPRTRPPTGTGSRGPAACTPLLALLALLHGWSG
ncbi:unnamed protein product [Oreochromis niloticus]|nr:unnamed protein product [Mustela putorius furo]